MSKFCIGLIGGFRLGLKKINFMIIIFSLFFKLGFPNGGDFGLASATLGLVFSVICGVMWVNIATHRGWVKQERIDASKEVKISIRFVDDILNMCIMLSLINEKH